MTEPLLLALLPEVFQVSATRSAPLRALAAVADDMHAPVHEVLDAIDRVVDPRRAPVALVPYLSRWVDLDWITGPDTSVDPALGVPSARQRDLIANAADLSARRGTSAGLRRFLHLATGIDGFEVEDVPGEFHVVIRVPTAAAGATQLVERIVAALKPAHVTSEIHSVPPVDAGPGAGPGADGKDHG